MIGRILWTEFFSNRDWPVASAVAVILLLVLIVPIVLFQRHQQRQREREAGGLMRRGLSGVNLVALTLGFAFLYIPILLLIIYSFNESKLVTVWAGFSTKWYAAMVQNELLLDAAWMTLKVAFVSSSVALVLGTLAGLALARLGRFPGRTLFSGHGLRAAGHARGHHRPLHAAALCRALLGARLLDRDRGAHHVLDGLRGGGGAVRGCSLWTARWRKRRWISARHRSRPFFAVTLPIISPALVGGLAAGLSRSRSMTW